MTIAQQLGRANATIEAATRRGQFVTLCKYLMLGSKGAVGGPSLTARRAAELAEHDGVRGPIVDILKSAVSAGGFGGGTTWGSELADLKLIAEEFAGPLKVFPWEQRHDALDDAAMVVNTTSLGMVGQGTLDIKLDKLPARALAVDIVYIPLETPFLEAARKRGNPTVNGLGMLLHQGRRAWQAWFGIEPEVTAELRAAVEKTIPNAKP